MKTRFLVVSALLAIAGQASASVIILNPGDANNFGQPLTCTVGVDTNPPDQDPPQPPRLVLVPIGQFHQIPNIGCIKNIKFDLNVGHLSTAVAGCNPQIDGPSKCDQTQILSSKVDDACYSYVAGVAKASYTSGQQERIQQACTEVVGVCLMNRPAPDGRFPH